MPRLTWDDMCERRFEFGVSNVVLYVKLDTPYNFGTEENPIMSNYEVGVPWNGVISVNEKPEGGEPTDVWVEDYKYDTLRSPEVLCGTIEAYNRPANYARCDGVAQYQNGISIGQQSRRGFAICYRTENGNDVDGTTAGYSIHVVYNMSVSPAEIENVTLNDSPEAKKYTWEFTTIPVDLSGFDKLCTIVFDSSQIDPIWMRTLESVLYGTNETYPVLPDPGDLLRLVCGS